MHCVLFSSNAKSFLTPPDSSARHNANAIFMAFNLFLPLCFLGFGHHPTKLSYLEIYWKFGADIYAMDGAYTTHLKTVNAITQGEFWLCRWGF